MLDGRKANLLKGVYVIIPAHNNLAVLKDTLTSLYPSYCHVIVVDDGSSDGTKEWLMQNYPSIVVLQGTGDYWWTGSIAKGVNYALKNNAKYIFSLNADVASSEKAILQLIDRSKTLDNAIVASIVVDSKDRTTVRWAGSHFEQLKWFLPLYVSRYVYKSGMSICDVPKSIFEVDEVHGRGVLIPVEVFQKIGNYDYRTFPQYGGDTDFSFRARKAGLKLYVDPNCISYVRSENTSIITHQKHDFCSKIENVIKYLTRRKNGEALRVWWILLKRHVPMSKVVPSYIFIILINVYRRIVN